MPKGCPGVTKKRAQRMSRKCRRVSELRQGVHKRCQPGAQRVSHVSKLRQKPFKTETKLCLGATERDYGVQTGATRVLKTDEMYANMPFRCLPEGCPGATKRCPEGVTTAFDRVSTGYQRRSKTGCRGRSMGCQRRSKGVQWGVTGAQQIQT